jgi:triosephosphate isomerase (TIM)
MASSDRIIAGNWKMNHGPEDARAFFRAFADAFSPRADRQVIFFPPAVSLAAAREAAGGREDLRFGVQNIYWERSGAYTGEISAPIAAQSGASHVLIGHSERRHVFGETIEETARKTAAALEQGLVPVLCVGETIDERRAGRAQALVQEQLAGVLDTLSTDDVRRLVIAYEPVWAIGTGETASPADAAEMHAAVRAELRQRVGDAAAAIPILYGGSVKADNAAELLAAGDVDGVLVGGASLDAQGFARICSAET